MRDASSPIWFVTRGAQPAGEGTEALDPSQAPVWGLGRVIALEHPALWGGLVDLGEPAADDASRLLAEITGRDDEDQIAFSGGRRYAPRLIRGRDPETQPVRLRGDASYLVTGGLGGLGLFLAGWLAGRGARHLVLVGRTALPERSRWDDPGLAGADRLRIETVRDLERAGVRVEVVAADVCDAVSMSGLFERFGRDLPPLRGIVHAAGVVDLRPIVEMGHERLAAALRPKVRGTWILHQLAVGIPLDFFALFSSTTALWGASKLAHYAAANSFLDGFAHYRRSIGLPATSIDWGLWERAGTAGDAGAFTRFGLRPMPAVRALDALGRILAAESTQAVVADVDWTVLKAAYSAKGHRPLFVRLEARRHTGVSLVPSGPSSILARLRAARPEDRRELLGSIVEDDVARVLGLDRSEPIDIDKGFFGMGMDSLTAVELKRRLEARVGETLPDTLTFNYPSVRALTDYLAGRVLEPEAPPTATAPEPASEDELIAMLAKKLRGPGEGDPSRSGRKAR